MNYWISPFLLIPVTYVGLMIYIFKEPNYFTKPIRWYKERKQNLQINGPLLKKPTRDKLSKMFTNDINN